MNINLTARKNNNSFSSYEFDGIPYIRFPSYCNELREYKCFIYKLRFSSKKSFNINLELNDIDFNNKEDITILLRIAENIFDNYDICIYKEWIYDLNALNTTQKNNVKDSNFPIDVLNYDLSAGKVNETKAIINVLNKLACMLDMKPVILLANSVNKDIYDKCIKDKKYIQLGENKILSEEEYNNIKFYNNIFKGVREKYIDDKNLFNIISILILASTATIDNYNKDLEKYIKKITKYFILNMENM